MIFIFSDSKSVLSPKKKKNEDTTNSLTLLLRKIDQNYCWITSHIIIYRNGNTDKAVIKATHNNISNIKISYTDLKKWQGLWSKYTKNKLQKIQLISEE